jgi:AcrR family transcriptional regulator
VTSSPATQARDTSLSQRIVLAAIETTSRGGWSAVTMGGVADRVGVSRQTVYNEVGSKPALAEAVVAHELAGFLSLVELAFDAHPDDPVAAVHDAALGVLVRAKENDLLRAVVSATQGGDTELLPLLTTHSSAVIDAAASIVSDHLSLTLPRVSRDRLVLTADVIVRTVLSHVMQPTRSPEHTAVDIAEVSRLLLA